MQNKRTSKHPIATTQIHNSEPDCAAHIVAVHVGPRHNFSKTPKDAIKLIENFGVQGDVHAGTHDQHLFHLKRYGQQPNLRQVHLIHAEFFDNVREKGHEILPGDLGENITTRNVDLLSLPTGTQLTIGSEAIVELTGLRNPCRQIEDFRPGLLKHCKEVTPHGVVRKAGVMGIVLRGGRVFPGDEISIKLPPDPFVPLAYRPPNGNAR
ncbi:MAG: MOSC domain-containing protein [Alphaproteobacteria bacterium]|nr:MOSC domain-containing protein [Alphaproteobacteria bacterium]